MTSLIAAQMVATGMSAVALSQSVSQLTKDQSRCQAAKAPTVTDECQPKRERIVERRAVACYEFEWVDEVVGDHRCDQRRVQHEYATMT